LIGKRNETVVHVDTRRAVIIGIDNEREPGDFGINAA
jgi:hypothetical protein